MEQKNSRVKKRVLRRQIPTTTSITCGTKNPAALGCVFYELEGGEVAALFTADMWHEGHANMMHGGLISAVLDEVMGRANGVYNRNTGEMKVPYVTGELTVRFLCPIRVGQQMTAFGRVDSEEGRKHFNSAEIVDEEGTVMATAKGIFVRVDSVDHHTDKANHLNDGQLLPGDPEEL